MQHLHDIDPKRYWKCPNTDKQLTQIFETYNNGTNNFVHPFDKTSETIVTREQTKLASEAIADSP